MSENGTEELEVVSGDKKFKLRGSDLLTSVIGMIVCSGLVLIGYVLYEHKGDAKQQAHDTTTELVTVVREMTVVAKEGVRAQREQTCLLTLPQELREKNTEFCKRMAQ